MEYYFKNYKIKNTIIPLDNRDIRLTIIDNPDQLLDKLSREDSEGRLFLPYWIYLWESAVALAKHLYQFDDMLNRKHVLEIGCGYGLTGIVAGWKGAKVVFTDFEQDALRFARHNVHQNGIDSAEYIQMDWNKPCFQGKFDVILAADVIYEEQNWLPVIRLLRDLMHTDSIAFFSEPNRKNADGFFKRIQEYGFNFEKTICSEANDKKPKVVNIYNIKRVK